MSESIRRKIADALAQSELHLPSPEAFTELVDRLESITGPMFTAPPTLRDAIRRRLVTADVGRVEVLVEAITADVEAIARAGDPSAWAQPWALDAAMAAIEREIGPVQVLHRPPMSTRVLLGVALGAAAREAALAEHVDIDDAATMDRRAWRAAVGDLLGAQVMNPADSRIDGLLDEIWRLTQAVLRGEEDEPARRIVDTPGPPVDRDEIIRVLMGGYLEVIEGDGIGAYDVARVSADELLAEFQVLTAGDRRRCRTCGCTDNYCGQCIRKTGSPCRWVADDLCSACLPDVRADAGDDVIEIPHSHGLEEPCGPTCLRYKGDDQADDDAPPF